MAYVVDFAKSSKEILLAEFNSENDLNLTPDQIEFRNFNPTGGGVGGASSVEIWWVASPELQGGVKVHFDRIDLNFLFSLCGLIVKEVDFQLPTAIPVVNQKLLDNIAHRYRVEIHPEEFEFVVVDGKLVVRPGPTNVAFVGEVVIEPSLRTLLVNEPVAINYAASTTSVEVVSIYPKTT